MSMFAFRRHAVYCLALLSTSLAWTAQAEVQVTITEPWVRATVPQQPATGAFMALVADEDARLVGADSPVAKQVEIHEMRMENDIMRMRQIPGLDLPRGQKVELRPGGYHIMLIGLHAPVTADQTVPLTLVVEDRQGQRHTVNVEAAVQALGAQGAGHGHGGHASHASQAHGTSEQPSLPASVEISQCWVRALPAPLPSAVYLRIRNGGATPVTLVAADAPGFGHVMLHQTQTADGVASMHHVTGVAVAPGTTVALEPGGYHVMLEQPASELSVGESLTLALGFEGYAPRSIDCEIRSARG